MFCLRWVTLTNRTTHGQISRALAPRRVSLSRRAAKRLSDHHQKSREHKKNFCLAPVANALRLSGLGFSENRKGKWASLQEFLPRPVGQLRLSEVARGNNQKCVLRVLRKHKCPETQFVSHEL